MAKLEMPKFATGGVVKHPTLLPAEPEELVIPDKGMKGPLSYDNCKKCVSQCEHAGKDRPFCYRDKSCKVTVVTNADRIRAMSDEELANWLDYMYPRCDWCDTDKFGTDDCSDIACTDCIFEWLKQPAKGE